MIEPALPVPPHSFDEPAAGLARRRALAVLPLHVHLDVRLNPEAQGEPAVECRVTHTVRALQDGLTRVTLDAADLTVSGAWQDGEPVAFFHHAGGIDVVLAVSLARDAVAHISLQFTSHPSVGLYFVRRNAESPERRPQIWSQGAMEDHHHWFPCFDAPQHMVTTEVVAMVPAPYRAISNGRPVEWPAEGEAPAEPEGWRRFHWRMEHPHALYLLTLVVDTLE